MIYLLNIKLFYRKVLNFMKKGWISAVLSFVFPGLGHFYLGRKKKGAILAGLGIISTILTMYIIGFFMTIILMVYSIYDSYKQVDIVNKELSEKMLQNYDIK